MGLGLDGSVRLPATIAHFIKDIAQTTPATYFNTQGVLFLGARMDDDVTPSFPPAGIRAGRLFCASARLKQWAA